MSLAQTNKFLLRHKQIQNKRISNNDNDNNSSGLIHQHWSYINVKRTYQGNIIKGNIGQTVTL